MRKSLKAACGGLLVCISVLVLGSPRALRAADAPTATYAALSSTLLARAQDEVARIRALVADGTLPKSRLLEAETQLADAQDSSILAQTLFGSSRVEDMTGEQAQTMLDAALRRVDRQSKIANERKMLLENGVIARSEFAAFQDELDARTRVLDLAQNRFRLVQELRQMADIEQKFERAARMNAPELAKVMIRYEGDGLFDLNELPTISAEFQKHFRRALPVSAMGQTLVHQSMGLDHRNRVDVALNPDQPEGIWLRQFLERLHVPYLGFRSAVAGAATAPHIHIGTGSTRLKLALR